MSDLPDAADPNDGASRKPFELVEVDPGNVAAPFAIRRVYVIYGTSPDAVRGKHAHHNLEQLAMCPVGACTFMLDDGSGPVELRLDRPTTGLVIRSNVWREMKHFTSDCVLTVLASQPYDPADYIRDYEAFLASLHPAG